MTKHPLKNLARCLGVTAVIVAGAYAPASAFTETKIQSSGEQAAPKVPKPNLNIEQNDGSPGLTLTTPDSGSGETELNIPGVGTIGTLPKLDFGLELLYGNGAQESPNAEVENHQDDVLIKGKIRHRF